jgi:DNA-binding LacI/PurR family transcriptional regulator
VSAAEPVRRPRLDDVAAEVGVSPATVSLVLRGMAGPSAATRERVLEAAARLGYRPDRAASVLASRRSRLIGVVMDVGNSFHAQLVEDVHEAAERRGYDLVLSTVTRSRDENRAVETLLDSRCEALLLLGPEAPAEQLTELGRQLPVVVVGRPVPPVGVDVVRAADDEGVAQAVEHLVGLGHRAVAYVDGGDGRMATLRRDAYQHAMRRHHLADHVQVVRGGNTESSGAAAARTMLLTELGPTAVLTFNDRCAMGLVDTLVRAGVSIATVSRVFTRPDVVAPATRDKVTVAARELGYSPSAAARALVRRRAGYLGLLVHDLANPFYAAIVKGVQREARRAGLLLFSADYGDEPADELLLARDTARQVDGLLLYTARPPDDGELLETIATLGPTVLIDNPAPGPGSVLMSTREGMAQAVQHLRALGHGAITYLAGAPEVSYPAADRLRTVRGGCRAWDVGLTVLGPFPPTFEAGDRAADRMPCVDAGTAAARLLLGSLTVGADAPDAAGTTVTLPTELIVRDSTGPAPT